MILLFVFLLLFTLLIWLILADLVLLINTQTNQYQVKLKGWATISLRVKPEKIVIEIKTFFKSFEIDPFKRAVKAKKHKKMKRGPKRIYSKAFSSFFPPMKDLFSKLLNTFRIETLQMNLDTGDYVLNAQLIPLFGMINKRNIYLSTSFDSQSFVYLVMKNRPVRILGVLIPFFWHKYVVQKITSYGN